LRDALYLRSRVASATVGGGQKVTDPVYTHSFMSVWDAQPDQSGMPTPCPP